jgi:hypothetical protein
MRHFPEWLFMALVMFLPLAVGTVRRPETFGGFLAPRLADSPPRAYPPERAQHLRPPLLEQAEQG